jgi:radical SAM protein with 4Fe4S-binding SPASM domain
VRDRKHTLETVHALNLLTEVREMGCQSLGLSGGGEPLLHPDFGTILDHAHEIGFNTWVNTNGSYISKWLDVLPLANVVRVSLDSTNQEQHKRMHAGKDFDAILEGIRALAGKVELGISYIIDGENDSAEDIAWVQGFAKEVQAFVQFKPLSGDSHAELHWPEHLSENEHFSAKRHQEVFFQREFEKCYAAMSTAVIGANGDVQACCDRRDLVYGNIYEQNFSDIWQSDRHKQMVDAIVPKFCSRCLMCGFNKSVEENIIEDQARTWLV